MAYTGHILDARMSTIIVYASTSGNTKAVAEYIAQKTGGEAVSVSDAKNKDLNSYDTVVIGGRVWAGGVPKDLIEYAQKNKDIISQKNTAFYVCCAYNDDKGQGQCDKLAADFGIAKHAFFNKGKKLVQSNTKPIDDFIATF
jgi:menaquinone-dependent protoporphyrinogen oxidase